MSVVYPWLIAAVLHWIMPLTYVVGVTYDGRIINPVRQEFGSDIFNGIITATVWFSEPVVEIRGFSQVGTAYTYPLVVLPDYPTLGMFLDIRIRP